MQYLETVLTEFPRIRELQNVERCAFVEVSGAGRIVPQYSYASGGKLFVSENIKGQWQLREETDVAATAEEMQVLTGNSPLSNASFDLWLTKPETVALFALLDHCRSQFLGQALGAAQFRLVATLEEIAAKAVRPLPDGLSEFFAMYAEITDANVVAEGLAGLAEKGICKPENGYYALRKDFAALARGLAVINGSALIQLWDGSGNSIRNLTGYALQGSLHDILMTTLYGDMMRVRAFSSQEMLGLFCNAMACPELPEAEEEKANTAPKFCINCGAKLNPGSAFCGNCGAKV